MVIEEGLVGDECSLMVLCDGTRALALTPAQDFKRVGDDDTGANTGGMGAYAPMRSATRLVDAVMSSIIAPSVAQLASRGVDYRGVLYAGLMLTRTGPKLLEYNVRFGDPETQALVPLYGDGLFDLVAGAAGGHLGEPPAASGAAVTVVLASRGYPEAPTVGDVISGLGDDGQLSSPPRGRGRLSRGHRSRRRGELRDRGRAGPVGHRASPTASARRAVAPTTPSRS